MPTCRRSTSTNTERNATTRTRSTCSSRAVLDPAVDFLADLAGEGGALELGIGTGRIALPLSRRGVPVHGIDLSSAMVARLEAKPGASDIEVTIGDFATTRVAGRSALAYLVFNTIMNLTTPGGSGRLLRKWPAQLEPGGCFVIEVRHPRAPASPTGRDRPGLHRDPDPVSASTSTTSPGRCRRLPSLPGRRRATRYLLASLPLRVAVRARSDGPAGRHGPARALGRLAPGAVHGDSTRHVSVWQKKV